MSRRVLVVACGLIYFFLMLPLLVVFPISLSSAPYMQFPPPGLSWQWYERYLDDPQWIDATWRSLYIGGATAVLALALGVPLAFSLVRGKFIGRGLLDRIAMAPVIVPTIILSVSVYGLFGDLHLPHAAAVGGLPDLAQFGALYAVPAAGPFLAMVRALSR